MPQYNLSLFICLLNSQYANFLKRLQNFICKVSTVNAPLSCLSFLAWMRMRYPNSAYSEGHIYITQEFVDEFCDIKCTEI